MSTDNPYDSARSGNGKPNGHGQDTGYAPLPGYPSQVYGQEGYGAQWFLDQGRGYQGYGGQNPYGAGPQRFGRQPGKPVGPVEAVPRMYSKYFQFSGRASRSEYWWAQLFFAVAYLVLGIPAGLFQSAATYDVDVTSALLTMVLFGFLLASIVPLLALTVRRLHDANLSGWFYLLALIPFVGGIVLLVLTLLPSNPEGARFDR